MSEPVALKYRAFLSYAHADSFWAEWLHRHLEGFHIARLHRALVLFKKTALSASQRSWPGHRFRALQLEAALYLSRLAESK